MQNAKKKKKKKKKINFKGTTQQKMNISSA